MSNLQKKILIFLPKFPVLTETFIEREISELISNAKLEITVLALEKSNGFASASTLARTTYISLTLQDCLFGFVKYGLLRPFSALKALLLVCSSDRVPFLLPLGVSKLEHETSFIKKMTLSRFVLYLKSFGYAYIFKNYNPEHLWVHFAASPSTLVMCASILLSVPYSMSVHARDATVDGSLLKSKIITAKNIFVCNKYVYEFICKVLPNAKNIHLQYHGVDFAAFDNYKTNSSKQVVPLIVTVSRLVEKKGQTFLIAAAEILRAKNEQFLIYIIGPGPLYTTLLNQIESAQLHEYVKILGGGNGLSFEETKDIVSGCDIFVFPAIETLEKDVDGMPNGVLEAAAFKKPCVVTNAGSVTDLIDNGNTGLVIAQKDPQALADAIVKLLHDKSLGANFGSAAYTKAKSLFDLSQNIKFYEEKLI